MAGVTVPTYIPTTKIKGGVHYDLISNVKSEPMVFSQATTSYVDNFFYGYADTIPIAVTPTSIPTPTSTQTPTTVPTTSQPSPTTTVPEIPVAAIIPILLALILVGAIARWKKLNCKARTYT